MPYIPNRIVRYLSGRTVRQEEKSAKPRLGHHHGTLAALADPVRNLAWGVREEARAHWHGHHPLWNLAKRGARLVKMTFVRAWGIALASGGAGGANDARGAREYKVNQCRDGGTQIASSA
jgi:hypothetical protein